MTTIRTTALILGSTLTVACSGEADIGLDSQPITCSNDFGGEVNGTVVDPYDESRSFQFGAIEEVQVTETSTADQPLVALDDGTLVLHFNFFCGAQPELYDVIPGTEGSDADCPLVVRNNIVGQIEILPADSGIVYVDERNADCFAGRFAIDYGEYGEVSGWFRAPGTAAQ